MHKTHTGDSDGQSKDTINLFNVLNPKVMMYVKLILDAITVICRLLILFIPYGT